jgi:post-segregation antitoxin (ccd killing protein)
MAEPSDQDREKAAIWRKANRRALSSTNEWVEAHGLPLRDYRLF